MNFNKIDKKLLFIVIISIIALFNAIYLTNMAYKISPGVLIDGASSVCDINDTFSCSSVFKNDFARIYGIPFSLLAIFVYPIIIIIGILGLFKKINYHYKIIFIISIFGLLFNSYIIYNEFLIATYCILCLICTIIIIINGILSYIGIREKNNF